MQILKETYERIEQTVEGTLQDLEQRRKSDKRKSRIIAGSIMAAGAILVLMVLSRDLKVEHILATLLYTGLTFFILSTFIFSLYEKKHNKTYKKQIVPKLVDAVFPGADYSPKGILSKNDLKKTGLFRFNRNQKYECEDTISGRIGKTDFTFCEIRISHEESDGEDSTKTVFDFFGFAFIADFNKHFQGRTLFSSKKTHLDVGFFSDLKPCVIEDPEFENRFTTYATDDQQARYIITPGLQHRILDLNAFFNNQELAISFHDDLMFMIVDSGTNHFEVSYGFDGVKRDLFALSLLGDIVEQMNLNLRIWSKE